MKQIPASYPELNQLQDFMSNHKVRISVVSKYSIVPMLTPVNLQINRVNFEIQVADEYNDLLLPNSLLHFVVVFMELANLKEAANYLQWCRMHHLVENNSELLNYYKTITSQLPIICDLFPNQEIDYYISDLDFQLNAGTVQYLRNSN